MQSTRKAEIGQKKILFYVHQDAQLKNKAERIKTKGRRQARHAAPPIPEYGRSKKQGATKTPPKNGSDTEAYCVVAATMIRSPGQKNCKFL